MPLHGIEMNLFIFFVVYIVKQLNAAAILDFVFKTVIFLKNIYKSNNNRLHSIKIKHIILAACFDAFARARFVSALFSLLVAHSTCSPLSAKGETR